MFDPFETYNLAADPAMAEVLVNMRDRLAHWMRDTGDPLLTSDRVPAPPGATVNHPDDESPSGPLIPA